VDLGVDFDGTITWNGQAIDRSTMDSYLATPGMLKRMFEGAACLRRGS
jgi:hypothetical protein